MTHDYNHCATCDLHWLLYGEVFVDTSTGKHVDPRNMLRHEDGRWELRSTESSRESVAAFLCRTSLL